MGGGSADGPAAARQMVGLAEKARREGLLALRGAARGGRRPVHQEGRLADRRRHRLARRRDDPLVRDRRHGGPPRDERRAVRDARRLRADARHPRHRPQPRARAREPVEPGRASATRSPARSSRRCSASAPANLIFLPIGNRLKGMSEVEVNYRTMILEGVLALQAGDNPSMLAERLDTFLDPAGARRRPRSAGHGRPSRCCRRPHERSCDRAAPQGRRSRRGPRGRRRALAPHLRRHDHAAHGAVHRHVGDLVREHDEVRRAVRVAASRPSTGSSSTGGENIQAGAPSVMPEQPRSSATPGQADRDRPGLGRARRADRRSPSTRARTAPPSSRPRRRRPREPRATSSTGSTRWQASHGLKRKVETTIDERGLVVRVLTDDLLFDSGKAALKPTAEPMLAPSPASSHDAARHEHRRASRATPTRIPISNAAFRSNWELSAARATAVLESLLHNGVAARRLSAAAYADQRPLATNGSAQGRSTNRRVELVVLRRAASGSRKEPHP